ncbi:hypothetical protein O1611_g1764 [Lasiodiplodia mahajangana]|uniref:Uncharacterized protein n=1 Tax=Lasiodiplodia mahajangana TaxID=1108764 RepID=A0ACC2JWT4_9PEZI|nr:hypothetical protein O1611_g1764 [Lasiodiplodia mahajangana]
MKVQALVATFLATLGTSAVLPDDGNTNPAFCTQATGIYDVCDTPHSFIRCNGHETVLLADCRLDSSSYCHIVNGRGRCDGTTPPDLSTEAPPCETSTSAVASPSNVSI